MLDSQAPAGSKFSSMTCGEVLLDNTALGGLNSTSLLFHIDTQLDPHD